jgi:hypothetical protein
MIDKTLFNNRSIGNYFQLQRRVGKSLTDISPWVGKSLGPSGPMKILRATSPYLSLLSALLPPPHARPPLPGTRRARAPGPRRPLSATTLTFSLSPTATATAVTRELPSSLLFSSLRSTDCSSRASLVDSDVARLGTHRCVLPRTASGTGHEWHLRVVQQRVDPARGRLHLRGGLCRAQLILLRPDAALPLRPPPQSRLLRAARHLLPQG